MDFKMQHVKAEQLTEIRSTHERRLQLPVNAAYAVLHNCLLYFRTWRALSTRTKYGLLCVHLQNRHTEEHTFIQLNIVGQVIFVDMGRWKEKAANICIQFDILITRFKHNGMVTIMNG